MRRVCLSLSGFSGVVRYALPSLCLVSMCAFLALPVVAEGTVEAHETKRGPRSVADLAERLMPAVVNISTRTLVDAKAGIPLPQVPDGSPFQEFFDDFFSQQGEGGQRKQSVQSLGSGFVIDATGLIVTNYHVIAEADTISVKFSDGEELGARLMGRDSKTDLALLKVDTDKALPTVSFGTAKDVRVGDWVMAIGNPFGLGGSVSVGIVSAQNRDIKSGPYDSFIQTDAAINRGNSGGPLFDMYGNVVGINTAIISPTGASIGLGFAIPSDLAQKVVQQLKDYGETRRGWLGIRIQQINEDLAEGLGLEEVRGALVSWVNEDGPAYAAKLQPGDVILEYDGHRIDRVRDLTRLVADTAIGTVVTLGLVRKGQAMQMDVRVGRLEENEKNVLASLPKKPAAAHVFGMSLGELTPAERKKHALGDRVDGVVVAAVEAGSVAARKGVKPGMVIVEMNQEIVSHPSEIVARVESLHRAGKGTILLLLARPDGGELVFVPFKIDEQAPPMSRPSDSRQNSG